MGQAGAVMAEFRKGEIAVVIPCFDLGATLEETVASVLTQTRAAAQIVVVDDGSTDAATQAALARIETGPARVLRGPHVGVARARARGVDETTTEFIVLLDADDVLQPTFLRKTAARMETDAGLEFVASNYELFGAVNAPVPRPAPDDLVAHLCEGSYAITALLRRTLWDRLGGSDPELPCAEDWDFWLRVLASGTRGERIDETLFRYRIRPRSRDPRGFDRSRYQQALRRIVDKQRALITRLGPELLQAKRRSLAAACAEEDRLAQERTRVLAQLAAVEHAITSRPGGGVPASASLPGAAVLGYHRVAALDPDTFGLCVPPPLFRAHLEYLLRHTRPMALPAILAALDAGTLPERAVALTFDDGYLDAFQAAEILAGVPATFYVNVERIDRRHEAWQEILERIFLSSQPIPPSCEVEIGTDCVVLPSLGPIARKAAFDTVYRLGQNSSAAGRNRLVERLSAWSGLDLAPRDSHRVVTADELVELGHRPGCDIGAHSAHHLRLPVHPRIVQRQEVAEGRQRLEHLLGRPVTSFAYPYGECPRPTVEIARHAGFASTVSTRTALLRPWDDPLEIPRVEVGAWSVEEFAARLESLFAARA